MKFPKLFLFALTFCIGLAGLQAQTVIDVDGNVYNTVNIGTQTWMKENLKTTKFNDNADIPYISDTINWEIIHTPAYCLIKNDHPPAIETVYGALYNWYAVNTGKLCPFGWHVPSDAEWKQLEMFLGMSQAAADSNGTYRGTNEGGKLKESGISHWHFPNTGATNESGFTALPGGCRWDTTYLYFAIGGSFWTSTDTLVLVDINDTRHYAFMRGLFYDESTIFRLSNWITDGYSVRCLCDNKASLTNAIGLMEVILYPNPATERLYLKNGNYTNGIIMIFDLQGKQVLSKQMDSDPIDISNLEKGIYVVKFVGSENVIITKFIKE